MKAAILLADDDAFFRGQMARYLGRRTGMVVLEAPDGVEALRIAREDLPAVAIIDRMMPGEAHGLDVVWEMKRADRTAYIPVILWSHLNESADEALGLAQGADAYIGKPFDPERLLALLKALLPQPSFQPWIPAAVGAGR